jgi:aerobic carbon-monoxide dehydrogenase small subunit
MSRHRIDLEVNGRPVSREVEARRLLVHFIREDLGLTGTHVGCDTSNCGACTVHLDDEAIKSCTVLAVQAEGHRITTIEGVRGPYDGLSAVQEGFRQEHGLQCGYCTPGMVMAVTDLIRGGPDLTDDQIREALEGNICRCTGYEMIVRSVRWALEHPEP